MKPRGSRDLSSNELFPRNVASLIEHGISHEWKPSSHDIVTTCPACGLQLAIDAEKPYWLCLGSIRCEINRVPFGAVIKALAEKVEVKS